MHFVLLYTLFSLFDNIGDISDMSDIGDSGDSLQHWWPHKCDFYNMKLVSS